jgi:hypothetical protein
MPDLRHDPKKLLEKAFTLYGTEYYRTFTPGLIGLINDSRNVAIYRSPKKHLELQLEIMQYIERMDKTVSDGKKVAKVEKDADSILEQRKRNRTLSLAYRSIVDGMAWRSFGFSRWTIRVVSQAKSPGLSHDKDGRNDEIKHAIGVVSSKRYVLLHDATNILRVGDLSLLPKLPENKPVLGEVKTGKRVITARSVGKKLDTKIDTSKQEERLLQAQVMLDTRRWFFKKQSVTITEHRPVNKDFLASAGAVMKQAMNKGVSSRYLSPYLYMEAYDIPKILDDFAGDATKFGALLDSLSIPSEELLGLQTNFDSLAILQDNEVVRTSPPYTAYPFKSEVIAKLITGQMLTRTMIIRSKLEEAFSMRGYELRIDENVLDKSLENPIDDNEFFSSHILFPGDEPRDQYAHIVHKQSGFMYPVAVHLAMITQEYISVEYIVSLAEAVRPTAVKGQSILFYQEIIDNQRWL